MQFNNYIWKLYKNTDEYKTIKNSSKNYKSLNNFFDSLEYESAEEEKEFKGFYTELYNHFKNKNFTPDNVEDIFMKSIKEGIELKYEGKNFIEKDKPLDWCFQYTNSFLLDILYIILPEFFFMYRFDADNQKFNFQMLQNICEYFEIALPPVPARAKKIERALYYIDVCKALYEFRKLNKLTHEELYAFIYDYAYNIITDNLYDDNKNMIEQPSKAWFIVDRFYNNADNITNLIQDYKEPIPFEFSSEAQEGDILVLYCAKPHSGLHSIWRVEKKSSIDIFNKDYISGYISNPVLIPNIKLSDMRNNGILSKNSIVLKTFGGNAEAPMKYEEYSEILKILEEKKFDISKLPKIKPVDFISKNIFSNTKFPNPSKAWFIVENPIDNNWVNELDKLDLPLRWQFGDNVAVGDIIILYCSKPHGGLHSIWRATDTSSIDPLFNWYKVGYIDEPIVIPNITLKEMRENKVLSQNKQIMINFYCANGSPVSYEEYQEILRILKEEKGFDISMLPKIEKIEGLDESIILNDERDVEIYLVEPLLKLLGYSANDYIRQMPIRMGRGVRYYPDYAFFANTKRGEETAKWVLETKYSIRGGDKDFREAFYQARSYAMRLYCSSFVLASKEGICLFSSDKKNNFNFDSYKKYSWNELKHSDNFHSVLQVVGKNRFNK